MTYVGKNIYLRIDQRAECWGGCDDPQCPQIHGHTYKIEDDDGVLLAGNLSETEARKKFAALTAEPRP